MKVNIRDLRQRISIEALTRTTDGQGGWVNTWSEFASVWAYIKPASAAERYFAQRIESNVTHKVAIRWLDGLTTQKSEMRIIYEGRIFQIKGIIREDEERWFHFLDCVENAGS